MLLLLRSVPCCLLLLLLLAGTVRCDSKDGHYHDADGDGDDEHDTKFDQDSFLGKERAQEFASLDEKASIEKLKKIIADEVDADKDGFVTEEELVKHLQKMHQQQVEKDIEMNWKDLKIDGEQLNWETYAKSLQPGFYDETAGKAVSEVALKAVELAKTGVTKVEVPIPAEVTSDDRILLEEYFRELFRQRRRWHTADQNSDDQISKQEYHALLFPDDFQPMREILVTEMMENIDSNGDGKISKEEYIADVWRPKSSEQKEPDWVAEERKEFDAKKDLNNDGFLDRDEVRQWIFDNDTGASGASRSEATHLLREADSDKDGKLSVAEIAAAHDLFAGSQATNFGQEFEPNERDEL